MKWWIMLAALTVYNVVFDWCVGRLGLVTIAWQGGMMSGLITAWMFETRSAHGAAGEGKP